MKENNLIKYDAMHRAIEAAYNIDEVLEIKNKADALKLYAKQVKNFEAERKAAVIRLRALRRIGQLTRELEHAKAGRPRKTKKIGYKPKPISKSAKLKELGLTKKTASYAEALASIPEYIFNEKVLENESRQSINNLVNNWRTQNDKRRNRSKSKPDKKDSLNLEARKLLRVTNSYLAEYTSKPLSDYTEYSDPETRLEIDQAIAKLRYWIDK